MNPCICDLCGRNKPTAFVIFKKNQSIIFVRYYRETVGNLCLTCTTKRFLEYEFITLFCTWWGIIGTLLGPIYLFHNFVEYLRGCWTILREVA